MMEVQAVIGRIQLRRMAAWHDERTRDANAIREVARAFPGSRGTGWRPEERLPVAGELGETSLMFLVHSGLNKAEIRLTCDVLARVMLIAAG